LNTSQACRSGSGSGLRRRQRVAGQDQFEVVKQAGVLQQRMGELRGLVGDAGDMHAHRLEGVEACDHAVERVRMQRHVFAVMLLIRRDGLLEQRRVRLGVHLAGEHALDQPRHAVAI